MVTSGRVPETAPPHTSSTSTTDKTPEPWIVCQDVSRVYGRSVEGRGVVSVTCQLGSAARVALTGPSGSGKSTLLHLMAGFETPTAGQVRWPRLGDPAGRPDGIGFVFQGPSLLTDLDVAENVALPLLFDPGNGGRSGESASSAAVIGALDRVALADLAGKLPDELSGGQAQRVAVARVLLSRPQVILADEPTGQLDDDTGQHVVSVLLEVADELGAAVVVATHDPRVARRLDHHWSMRDGRLATGRSLGSQPITEEPS